MPQPRHPSARTFLPTGPMPTRGRRAWIPVWFGLALALLLGVVPVGAAGTAPPVGTSITSAAKLSYLDPATGQTRITVLSNTVVDVVTLLLEVTLQKSSSTATANPGEAIRYRIEGQNRSNGDLPPIAIQLDNTATQAVVVRDQLPANTTIDEILALGSARVVYHLAGAPRHSYQRARPADLSRVDAVAFLFDSLAAEREFALDFSLKLTATANGEIRNQAELYTNDGTGTAQEVAVTSAVSVITIDGPVIADGSLTLEKVASQDTINFGETLQYRLTLRNQGESVAHSGWIEDQLPAGFQYLSGTARLDGQAIADPTVAATRVLRFPLGDLAVDQQRQLTYRVRVGVGAERGKADNRARLYCTDRSDTAAQARSDLAIASVTVRMGTFTDEAYILGKVFIDSNENGVQDQGEVGVPGIRLILETGDFVITDEEGKYSFYGIEPRTHVLRVDPLTVPQGARFRVLDNRNSRNPQSRFVDLKKGQLHQADFALGRCTPEVMQQIQVRRNNKAKSAPELIGTLKGQEQGNPLERTEPTDTRSRPASGIINRDGRLETLDKVTSAPPKTNRQIITQDQGPVAMTPTVKLEPLMATLPMGLDFLDLKDNDTLPADQIAVRIKGSAGSVLALLVNDQQVPVQRVGQKVTMASRGLQAWEYIGVQLRPGENRLTARQQDPFGNVRAEKTIRVLAPGRLTGLQLIGPKDGSVADGATPAHLIVRLVDDRGTPVSARTPLTLETTLGRWDVEDLNPREPGVQTFIEGGEAAYDLLPPLEAGKALIRISSGALQKEAELDFLPHLRPLIGVGVIEGAVSLKKLDPSRLKSSSEFDAFEREISTFSFSDQAVGGRSALYLKGKVRGDYLLTLAYDSDKDTHDRLFRDIEPDRFYPVYGDSSVRGFDAQSSSRAYVRVDKGKSYLLYGDYTTMETAAARPLPVEATRLGQYSRSLTGASSRYENDRVSLNFFGAHTDSSQQVAEFRALGVSGPYPVNFKGLVRNSERVELITRDRQQPALVIATRTLNRFVDYSVDDLGSTLLFDGPVAGVDEDLNPVFIRVTWETESAEKAWVYGFNGDIRLTDWLTVGATHARDEHPENDLQVVSGHATIKLGEASGLVAEVAQTNNRKDRIGQAGRMEIVHKSKEMEARAYAVHTDPGFDNPNAAILAGRNEAGAAASHRLTEKTRMFEEVVYSTAVDGDPLALDDDDQPLSTTDGDRVSLMAGVEQQLLPCLRARLAGRYSSEQRQEADMLWSTRETRSVLGRFDWQPWFLAKATTYIEYEQALADSERRMLGVGANYQIMDRARLYARHEFLSTLDTEAQGFSDTSRVNPLLGLTGNASTDRQTTLFGIQYDYLDNNSVFSEYRAIGSGINGPEAEAAMGLRNRWLLTPELKVNTSIERIQPVAGETDQSMAIAGGVSYGDDKTYLTTARLEWRGSDSADGWLATAGYASKLAEDLTFLISNSYWQNTQSEDSTLETKNRLRAGTAWRQTAANTWTLLSLYEFKTEQSDLTGDHRDAHIWSLHQSYKPSAGLVVSGRYAGEVVIEDNLDYEDTYTAHLLSARLTHDLTDRIDCGLSLATLFDHGFDNQEDMLGLEVGYQLIDDTWLTLGYNLFGFHTRDLAGDEVMDQGPYFRIRIKFDEGLFKWLQ